MILTRSATLFSRSVNRHASPRKASYPDDLGGRPPRRSVVADLACAARVVGTSPTGALTTAPAPMQRSVRFPWRAGRDLLSGVVTT